MFDTAEYVYPGQFVPVTKESELIDAIKRESLKNFGHPSVEVVELHDSYSIEVPLHGYNREEILINVRSKILTICAGRIPALLSGDSKSENEMKASGYVCNIILPKNVDPEYGCAEYKSGILQIHLFKNAVPPNNKDTRIIVY
ncbi:MAG: hypothetical protein C5B59_03760 [Bacteroidetes bacterium]|nr:MAG: hypothetical protein C5B59_03760 [Bacteroidota bacterium]